MLKSLCVLPAVDSSSPFPLFVLSQMQLKLVCAFLLVLHGHAAVNTNPPGFAVPQALDNVASIPLDAAPEPVKPHNPPGYAAPEPHNPPDGVVPRGSLRGTHTRSTQARSWCTLPHCAQCSSGPLIICNACKPGYSLYKGRCSVVIDFDSVTALPSLLIPYGYQGLNWDHCYVMDPLTFTDVPVTPSGYQLAVVSGKYIAYTGGGFGFKEPRSVWAPAGAVFTLNSFSIMAAWNNQLSVLVQGYAANGSLLKAITLVVDAQGSPVTHIFEWQGINKVTFYPYGGVKVQNYPSIGDFDNVQIAIDNLRISPAV
jgi:hypothetical protein